MAKKIILDAGHGGSDPGAVFKGRQEKDDNLRLTLAVGEELRNRGVDVEYTRTTDVYQTPFEKATIANESGADFFVSFHRNSSPEENQYNGVEVLVYDKNGEKIGHGGEYCWSQRRSGISGNRCKRKARVGGFT